MELEHEGECIVLAVPDAVLGRTSASEIHVSHPLVSRRHCRFEATRDGVFIEDLGSSNGTHLNGERLTERQRLFVGDVVQIGQGGPRFTLQLALVDGRDVGADVPGEDQATILSGDPRAAAFRARVEVSPEAAPTREAADATTRDQDITPHEEPMTTTGSIPIATPIGTGGESLLGATDILPPPEPATREAGVAPRDDDEQSTRPVRRGAAAAPPPSPDATQPATPERARRNALAPPPEPAAPEQPARRAVPPTVSSSKTAPSVPDGDAGRSAPAATGASRGSGVLLGFVLGILLALALGVLTPLGATLHGLAPWSAPAEDAP